MMSGLSPSRIFRISRSLPLPRRLRAPAVMGLAGAVAGLGLGWLARSWKGSGPGSSPAPVSGVTGGAETVPLKTGGPSPAGRQAVPGAGGVRVPPLAEQEALRIRSRAAGLKGVDFWLTLLGAAENASPPVLAALADSLADEPPALALIGERWAELSPADLLSSIRKKAAGRALPPGARPVDRSLEALQKILTAEWFRRDPAALVSALSAAGGSGSVIPAKQECLRLLTTSDPGRALQLSLQWGLTPSAEGTAPLLAWARENARRTAALLLEKPPADHAFPNLLTGELARALSARDPAGSMDLAVAADSRNSWRWQFASALLGEWAKRDVAAAAAYLAGGKVEPSLLPDVTGPFMEAWGATDPSAAMEWAGRHLKGLAKDLVPASLVKSLGARDPVKAAEFVNQLDPGMARDDAMRQLTSLSVKTKDKAALLEAFHWMMAMPDPALRSIAMDSGAPEIMAAAPDEVLAWLRTPEGAQAPPYLLVTAGRYLTQKDGPAAMEWAAGLRPEVADEVRQRVLQGWTARDPGAAQAWVRSLPDGGERATRVAAVTTHTSDHRDEKSITAWLDSLPASDHSAMLRGLNSAYSIDPALKTRLLEKYK